MTEKHGKFNPDDAATADSGIFGLPHSYGDAALFLMPVPWEATTSYGGGTSQGPAAILEASKQVDLFDRELGRFYEEGLFMPPISQEILKWNEKAKGAAQKIIQNGGSASHDNAKVQKELTQSLALVNDLSQKVNESVYSETRKILKEKKIVGLVGGDHSTPFGAIQAYLEKYPAMGILHFDAHADLRQAYEGFQHSHASIMHNVIHQTKLPRLVQVGIRDFSESEFLEIQNSGGRIQTFFDQQLSEMKTKGTQWSAITGDIISALPHEVYISFDIDGLDPTLCPHTGTPVPGGLSFNEALFLIKCVAQSGRHIVGFDLNEVTPGPNGDEWDANVGARLLYKLCGWTLQSRKNRKN